MHRSIHRSIHRLELVVIDPWPPPAARENVGGCCLPQLHACRCSSCCSTESSTYLCVRSLTLGSKAGRRPFFSLRRCNPSAVTEIDRQTNGRWWCRWLLVIKPLRLGLPFCTFSGVSLRFQRLWKGRTMDPGRVVMFRPFLRQSGWIVCVETDISITVCFCCYVQAISSSLRLDCVCWDRYINNSLFLQVPSLLSRCMFRRRMVCWFCQRPCHACRVCLY